MIPINLPSLITLSGQQFIQQKNYLSPKTKTNKEKKTDVKLSVQVHKNSSTVHCESKNKNVLCISVLYILVHRGGFT